MNKTIAVLVTLGLALTLWSGSAQASTVTVTGYACRADFSAQPNVQLGHDGYTRVRLYSGPECTGSYLGTFTYTSRDATYGGHHLTKDQLTSMFRALVDVMRDGLKLTLWANSSNAILSTKVYSN